MFTFGKPSLQWVNRLYHYDGVGPVSVKMFAYCICHRSAYKSALCPAPLNTLRGRSLAQSPLLVAVRGAATKVKPSEKGQIMESTGEKTYAQLTVGEKVKQASKDAGYTGIVVVGIGVTCLMFYAIGRELFSKQSPSGVYGQALKECRKTDEVKDTFGEPLKGYGEMNRRGRRRHVSHTEFFVEGVKHMRMKFYIEGPSRKGTVHLEVKQNDRKKWEYRYLFITLDDTRRTIIVHDNR